MGTPRAYSIAFGVVLALANGGCGGSDGPPAPLGRHFDEMQFLGSVPPSERKAELDAKGAYDLALMEQSKAKADYDAAKVMLDVAKNEREAAKLDEKSAQSRQKAAKDSADMNRIAEAEKESNGVRLAADAADKRYNYLKAYSAWLKKLMRYTEHNTYWREAQYELAQAKIAKEHNIQPQGFAYDNYVKQEADRAKKTSSAKSAAEGEKSKAVETRKTWLAVQGQSDKLLGKKNDYPDPLDPSKVEGSGITVGGGGVPSDKEIENTVDSTIGKDKPAPGGGMPKDSPKGPDGDDPDSDDDEGDDESADPDEGGE